MKNLIVLVIFFSLLYVEKLYDVASKSSGHHEHEEESGEHHGQ
jgi:hypothetical protein